jgi:hypothetical protein
MAISPVGSDTAQIFAAVAAAGRVPDPQAQQAQVNAQADLLQAMNSTDLPLKMVAARVSDGKGVDVYL